MKINSANHPKVKHFVEFVKKQLAEKGGKLILRTNIANGETQDGEFCEKTHTIRCKKSALSYYWVGVLAHEYSHFVQATNKTKAWINFQKNIKKIKGVDEIIEDKDGNEVFIDRFTKKEREEIISAVIDMELECEKMTLKVINHFDLPLDKNEYVILANIILYKYLYWAEYESWPSFDYSSIEKWDTELRDKMKSFANRPNYKKFSEISNEVLKAFY